MMYREPDEYMPGTKYGPKDLDTSRLEWWEDEDPGYPYNLPECPRCSGKHDPYDRDCYGEA